MDLLIDKAHSFCSGANNCSSSTQLVNLTTCNYHITASQPGIGLPGHGQTEISFLWQTGLQLHFTPQAKAMWQLMKSKINSKADLSRSSKFKFGLWLKPFLRFIHNTMQPRT
jgi:hypothetical protein